MKNKKTIIIVSSIVIFIIVVCILVYFYYKKKKEQENNIPETDETPTPKNTIIPVIPVNDPYEGMPLGSLPMKIGQNSKIVGIMQMALNDLYGAGLKANGNFEKTTENSLIYHYQTKTADYNICSRIYNDLNQAQASKNALSLFYNSILKK